MSFERMVHDPCHGDITLDALSWDVIDTPQFQRLRELKQLGTAYYVFPGASHNRFEHSIGVGHLAGDMIQRLQSTQPELEVSQEEVQAVRIAGLCHDLGHGPFSHVFDSCVIPAIIGPNANWSHEDASTMMFHRLVDDNGIDLSTDQTKLVTSLFDGTPPPNTDRKFLYQIVANKQSSLDVDKFDYIIRDTMNVGLKTSYDPSRLLKNYRVIDSEICYHVKEAWNIYELFHTRYSLFKRIYTHKTCNGIELLMKDALVAANPVLRFDEAIHDPDLYLRMTDSILRDIEYSSDPLLERSRGLLKRLRTRDIYRCCDEVVVEYGHTQHIKHNLTPAHIVACAGPSAGLVDDDIRVDVASLHFGMKNQDPVQRLNFFGKHDNSTKIPIKSTETSQLVPRAFCETVVRVYATNPEKVEVVQQAFRKCIEPLLREVGSEASPSRVRTVPAGSSANNTPRKKRSFDERESDATQNRQKMFRRDWTM
ncbi:HD phosphohydrolase domain-containing protein [Catenaria anguillulae PL171]|uniref:HD phosphohydrolase domain-containing protein n=1 Tax=Catenaria anguillulae PL171 TaxID=765915 RepID=A0A1Y2HU57_9FUNG|nr:HD phosphohydrolase domain-containing protein [Catenaria anguillulae PL171]